MSRETRCIKDEESGQNWGNNGKSARMVSRHTCSDWGYYDAEIIDCGGWRFRAKCSGGVPADWSIPYSDEGARARQRENALNDSRIQCIAKGYAGTNGASRDKGQWHYSHQCINPGWVGDWQNNGCLSDGQTRWSRQVNANGLDWNIAADWLLSKDVSQHKFSSVWKDNRGAIGGMWIVANRDDGSACKPEWSGNWIDEGCKAIGKRQWARKVNAKNYTWENAADWLKSNSMTPFNNNTGWRDHRGTGGMWVVVQVDDNTCNPGWIGDWNNRGGCQSDGQTRWARQVDAKGLDWNVAADWLIANDTKQHNFSKVWKEINNGMWIVALRDDKACFRYNGQINNDGCSDLGKSTRAQQCNDWPSGWIASNDVVNACKKNAPPGSTVSINGTQVWAKWNVDDSTCIATPEGWSQSICTPTNGIAKFWTKLSIPKGIDWKKAGDSYVNTLKTVNNISVTPSYRQDTTGAYVDATYSDPKCTPKSFILGKPYTKEENLDENIKGIPSRFNQAMSNAVFFS